MYSKLSILKTLIASGILFSAVYVLAGQGSLRAKADDVGQPAASGRLTQPTADNGAPALHSRNRRYVIHASDTLELTFALSPEFNQTVIVQPDGYISLREVGDMLAAGQTLPELTDSIK